MHHRTRLLNALCIVTGMVLAACGDGGAATTPSEPTIAGGDFRSVDKNIYTALVISLYLGSISLLDPEGKVYITPEQLMDFVMHGLKAQAGMTSQ